ncbi:hypothetical protein [Stenotrophomonas sp. CFBP 13718]|uniref:hypothetical protein n=1 Tax=Stenotrophomonas sp. CFBP 13718 TaxID=2775304 RepID=UPI0017809AE5|nr:hypothetical protein [Stenotrophomonas sp. CFBP 13718]MBD8696569.1 hypothetical protein [Stenotrophomonas sp. CFBP 13718]
MTDKDQDLRQMAQAVADAMGARTGRKVRRLRVVGEQANDGLNAIQRDVLYSRIRDLSELYSLAWLVRQETMEVSGIMECLTDEALQALLATVECAVECVHEGVPFVEKGLIKGLTCNWVA